MDFSGISKQNAHGGRNVMLRCLSEGVDIFLKSANRQGESGHDVRVSRSAPWMARVGDPVMMRTAVSLFNRKFTPGDATSRRDVPFAVGVRGFYGNPTLRAMHSIHKCVAKGAPLTNISLTDLPCPISPRADPHRYVRSDRRKRSACR